MQQIPIQFFASAIFKDKCMFTVPLHGWHPFSSLLKDIYHMRQLNVYGNARGAPVTRRWQLKMEKCENVKAMLKVH